MRYGVSIPTLLGVLLASGLAHQALSQSQPVFDQPTFDPASLFDPNTDLPTGIDEQLTITQNPQIPRPGDTVSVQLTSYVTDLNRSTITWTLDGRNVSSGVGITRFEFQAPAGGSSSRLVVTINKNGGGTISRTIVVSPADVDLIYEANTYVHPFYKGKKLFTSESSLTFIAIPNFVSSNGATIKAENLSYIWRVNGSVQQSVSGYGRNKFLTRGSLIERPMQISVEVTAPNSTLQASQSINVQSTKPEMTLYENNPLLGVMYDKAIQGTFVLERPQVDFEGIPYFFSGSYKDDPNFDFNWYINGTDVASKAPNENYMVLRNDQNQEGTALISVSTSHITNMLQTANTSLELDFKKVDNNANEQFTF